VPSNIASWVTSIRRVFVTRAWKVHGLDRSTRPITVLIAAGYFAIGHGKISIPSDVFFSLCQLRIPLDSYLPFVRGQ